MKVALSIGVQRMLRSDLAGSGVSIDTETGFPRAVLLNAAFGLGESIVAGTVDPDEYSITPDSFLAVKQHVAAAEHGGTA